MQRARHALPSPSLADWVTVAPITVPVWTASAFDLSCAVTAVSGSHPALMLNIINVLRV
jgi:hypothetical protein